MSNSNSTPTTVSFDLKKYRIRIHKATLRLLGDPKYIQLLVNPNTMEVAIRGVDKELSGAQTHKIDPRSLRPDIDCEIYSRSFMTKLFDIVGDLEANCTYRATGEVIPTKRIAVYSLKTLKRVEAQENLDDN